MKKILLGLLASGLSLAASAQYTFDVLQYSSEELRGTSRFQAMAGSMGGLGGDLSAINVNPGGIGIYRSSDVSITPSLEFNKSTVNGDNYTRTRVQVNQVGYAGSLKINSDVMPYFNWAVSYNRKYSARRRYMGAQASIPTSITNYLADWATVDKVRVEDLSADSYTSSTGANWNQILAYQNNLMLYTTDGKYSGLGVEGTYGENEFEVEEWGFTDQYSLTLGGNIRNKVYWGLAFAYTAMEYKAYKYYGEALYNTVIYKDASGSGAVDGDVALGFSDGMRTTGDGFTFKAGAIFKPVNELRFGVAFHTPTWFKMKDTYTTTVAADFYQNDTKLYTKEGSTPTNSVWYTYNTPWHFIGSMGVVAGKSGLLNVEYECVANRTMRIGDQDFNKYPDATTEIKNYLQSSHIVRIGGEYRVTKEVSLRAGYSYQSSPVKKDVREDKVDVMVSGSCPAYSFDKSVQYFTAGIGYHNAAGFYADLAYVHKNRANEYRAVPANFAFPDSPLPAIGNSVTDNNNRISLTLGMRF